jgi:hypothetical protein
MKWQTPAGAIVISGALGTCTVLGSVVVANGMFRGVGQVVDPNLPTDGDNVTPIGLVLPADSIHLVSTTVGITWFSPQPAQLPVQCAAAAKQAGRRGAPGSSPPPPAAPPARSGPGVLLAAAPTDEHLETSRFLR